MTLDQLIAQLRQLLALLEFLQTLPQPGPQPATATARR